MTAADHANTAAHRGIRITLAEIDDLCYRHVELEESLTTEEIDRLIDTAGTAHALAEELARIAEELARIRRGAA